MSTEPPFPGGAGPDVDAELDAYLRQALRHAPDAGMAAPAALSEAILEQARIVAGLVARGEPIPPIAADPPPTLAQARRRAARAASPWAWLTRPAATASFAGLTVATLVGVMWWGRPVDESLTEFRAPVATPPATSTRPQPPETEAAAPVAAPAPRAEADKSQETKTKALPPTAPPQARTTEAAPARPAAPAPSPAPSRDAKIAEAPAKAADAKRADKVTGKATPGADPEVAALKADAAAAAAAQAPAAAAPAPPRSLAQPKSGVEESAAPRARVADSVARAAPADALTAPSPVISPNPVYRLRAAVQAWPEVWTWQRGNGAEQRMNDAVQAWLERLDQATPSRWQAAPLGAGGPSARPLRLLRNGQLHSTIHIEPAGVRVDSAAEAAAMGGAHTALPGASAEGLRAALDRAAP